MPQPALSQVSVLGPRPLAPEAGCEPAAGALCPRGLHRARTTGAARTPQPASVLQPAVSGRFRDPAPDRRRSTPSGRSHRRARCAAHLVAEPGTSSPPALPRSRRRTGARPLPLGSIKARLLPAGACAQPHVPRQAARNPQAELPAQRTMLPRHAGRTLNPTRLSLSAWVPAPARVGGLFHASLRRTRTRPEVPARYTHRVAISNARLLSLDNGQERFRWRDSRHNNRSRVMTLDERGNDDG